MDTKKFSYLTGKTRSSKWPQIVAILVMFWAVGATAETPEPNAPNGEGDEVASPSHAQGEPASEEGDRSDDRAKEVATGVQKMYETTKDMVANFEQDYIYKVTGAKRRSSGKVYFKKPGMMRWDYEKPEPRFFVSNGEELFVYEPEARQAFRRNLNDSGLAESVAFLFGQGDLVGSFHLSMESPTPEGLLRLRLTPKEDEGHYRRVVLEVDPQTHLVMVSEVEDPVGNVNRITFKDIQRNVGLPTQGFHNPIPNDVKIIEAGVGL